MSQLHKQLPQQENSVGGLLSRWVRQACAMVALALGLHATPVQAQTVYYHNNAGGSPIAATDEAGNLLWRESYRPYGERMLKPVAANTQWFHGKQLDPDTGMEDFGARNYDPVLGRFLSIDPVEFSDKNIHSFNRYNYGNNNPLKYIDPDGRNPVLMRTMIANAPAPIPGFQQGPPVEGLPPQVAAELYGSSPPPLKPVDIVSIYDRLPPFLQVQANLHVITMALLRGRGGESTAAADGRRAHNNYGTALGENYDTKAILPSGKKPDAVDWVKREVRELKPDNARAVKRGERQVEGYRQELEKMTGDPWTSEVDVYKAKK